ncbi:MAG: FAD-dependent oxidoreductase [Bacilli bacterium]|nr:FAD-dependent oxidoreductase [Bacilli bacterium]
MKTDSLWLENITEQVEEILKEDMNCDVLIVGAGMTGLSTAYHLKNKNLKVVVVEKNKIGKGISARTTGKITYLQDTIYCDLTNSYSEKVAKKYFYSQKDAIEVILETIEKEKIECNLKKVSSYIFSKKKEKLEKEKKLLKKFGVSIKETKQDGYYAVGVEDTYVFHPVKYMQSLKDICKKAGIKFYEHTDVNFIRKEDNGYICGNELVKIRAKKVVLACHYPYFLFPFLMPLKCTLEKSYISATPVKKVESYSAISIEKPIVSLRYHEEEQNYLIYLTNSHSLYKEYDDQKHFEQLKKSLKRLCLEPKYLWSNHDIMTFDKLPFVGLLKPNLYLATGYNTWGMTNSNLAGKIISDIVMDIYNPYELLFSLKRKLKKLSLPETIYGGIKPMIENKVWKNKDWYPENVYFETRNGKNVAIYVDKSKKEHIVYNTCPHLKCSLLFNSVEKTWDCPCHGSRFDLDGKVIVGPSNYNITYHE